MNLLCICVLCRGETYEGLLDQLESATEKADIHRLKSQTAREAIERLEHGDLSKAERNKLKADVLNLCSNVQLGAMDIWYGEAVVTWGRMLLLDGNWKDARSQMFDQAEVLQNIEQNLKANKISVSSISPVAGCRYVLGETYRLEFEELQTLEPAIESLKHFYNVYIKYNDSSVGEKARAKAEAMRGILENEGKRVRIDLGSHKNAFVASKFRLGARLVHEERFAEAAEPIETAINYFPETVKSVEALRNLAVSKMELGLEEEAIMIAEYCCERFSSDTNAPLAVLSLGRRAGEELSERFYKLYLNSFPEHEHRSNILSWFAWKAYKTKDMEEALHFFAALEAELRETGETGERLEKAIYIQAVNPVSSEKLDAFMAEFPESQFMPSALGKKAQALLVGDDFSGAFLTLEKLKDEFPEAEESRKALSGLIIAAVEAGRYEVAEQVLRRMLEDEGSYGERIYRSTGERLLNAEQYELAAMAFAAIPSPYGIAACQFGTDDFEGCYHTLEAFLDGSPTSGRFYDVRLMQARCLVKLGRMEEAIMAYSEAGARNYTVTLEMAGVLSDPEERLAAYQRVALLADPDANENRPLIIESIMTSLPLCMELKKYELALDSCDQFEDLFPEHDQLPIIAKYRREATRALAN